jgi:hypothetical protein
MRMTLRKEVIGGLSTQIYPVLTCFVHIMYEDLEPSVMLEIDDA